MLCLVAKRLLTGSKPIDMNDAKTRELLKVYRVKSREGFIDRVGSLLCVCVEKASDCWQVVDEQHVIVKDLFKKETDIAKYMNFPVTLQPSGERAFRAGRSEK